MNIKCPYCDNESSLSQWKFYVDEIYHFFEDKTICKKICSSIVCPICSVEIYPTEDEDTELILEFNKQGVLQNSKDIKEIIEGRSVDIDDKLLYCPSCKKWKSFSDFTFTGNFVDSSELLVYGTYIDVSIPSEFMLIRGVKCDSCKHKISLEPIEVTYPLNEETKIELYKILKNYSLKHFKIEEE